MAQLDALVPGLREEFVKAYTATPRGPDGLPKWQGRRFLLRDRCMACIHTPSGRCPLHEESNICDLSEFSFWGVEPYRGKCDCGAMAEEGHFRCMDCMWKLVQKQLEV